MGSYFRIFSYFFFLYFVIRNLINTRHIYLQMKFKIDQLYTDQTELSLYNFIIVAINNYLRV